MILTNDFHSLIVESVASKQLDLVCHNMEVITDNKSDHIQHYKSKLNIVYLLIEHWLVDDELNFHYALVASFSALPDHHM